VKATFALLADTTIHNLIRRLSWEFHQRYRAGTLPLPPHVSLKQPFAAADLPALEEYMNSFARSIEPFDIKLTKLDLVSLFYEGTEYGILWADVQKSEELRGLHNRLNEELTRRFGPVPAEHDGEDYHFHMTVMMGGQTIESYRRFYSELENTILDRSFPASELAMFVYDESLGPDSEYLCYKILPVGKSNSF
jgi:2'-5' RNA ligase